MDSLRWPHSRNVAWIERQLFETGDLEQRHALLKQLLQELDQLAHDAENCQMLELRVGQTRARIERQREIIAEYSGSGRETAPAKFLLATMLATLALYIDRYRILLGGNDVAARALSTSSCVWH